MQVSEISQSQNFSAKFTPDFHKIMRQHANRIKARCSKNSPQYDDFIKTIKDIRTVKTDATFDLTESSFSDKVALYTIPSGKKSGSAVLFDNDSNLFKNILNFMRG